MCAEGLFADWWGNISGQAQHAAAVAAAEAAAAAAAATGKFYTYSLNVHLVNECGREFISLSKNRSNLF